MSLSQNFPTLRPTLRLDFINSSLLDPRVTFTRASSATYFDELGVLQTATTNTPRFDYNPSTLAAQGLLIEEARTNGIRNNTMQGAVAGTPGTLPTNWISQNIGGIALTEIVGTGTEDGIAYVDVRYTGTTSSTALGGVLAEQTTQIAALSGQTWASSFFLRIVGGSTANISDIANSIQERNSGGSLLSSTNTIVSPTGAPLSTQRFSTTRTLTDASTAFVGQRISLTPVSGAAIDITLRIGLPQLELGAFATSVIPTTSSAVTRAADVASVNTLSPWYNASQGTLYFEGATFDALSSAFPQATIFSDGTNNNRIGILRNNASGNSRATVANGGAAQFAADGTSWTLNAVTKAALAYEVNNFAFVANGGAATTDTSGTLPTVDRLRLGVDGLGSSSFLNGHIRRITYYPRRLSNAELQAITT
jgi:hypothetical protein